jgi:hypothetical protein
MQPNRKEISTKGVITKTKATETLEMSVGCECLNMCVYCGSSVETPLVIWTVAEGN